VPGIVMYGCLGGVIIAWRARKRVGMHTLLHGNGGAVLRVGVAQAAQTREA
jgi:hypothetical protein